MKRKFVFALLIFALVFVGAAEAAYRINIATATTGGAYYPIGNAMAQIWAKNSNGEVRASAQATAGTPQNIELMQDGEVQIGIGQNGVCLYAYDAIESYTGQEPYKEMRGMFTLYPNVMHWVVGSNSGIKSVADMKGKKIIPGQVASATEINSREMLSVYGLNYMKDKGATNVDADYLGYNEAVDQMKNGQAQATHIAGGVPTASVMDITSSGLAVLLSMEKEKIDEICTKYPWYFPYTIPKGTYPKQEEDVHTIALSNILFTDAGQPEELIYMLTKLTYEFHDDMVIGHKATEYTIHENAFKGMTIPLHSGAVKYFQEKGMTVPEKLIVK